MYGTDQCLDQGWLMEQVAAPRWTERWHRYMKSERKAVESVEQERVRSGVSKKESGWGKSTEKQLVFRITAFHSRVRWFVVSSAADFHVRVYAAAPVPPLLPHIPSESLSFFLIAIFIIINQLPAGHEAGSLAIFPRPTLSGSFPSSHTPSSTSLTFPPHLPHRLSCSLSPALKLPPIPPASCKLICSLCNANVWLSQCCILSRIPSAMCLHGFSSPHYKTLLYLVAPESLGDAQNVGNLKKISTLIVKTSQNMGGKSYSV